MILEDGEQMNQLNGTITLAYLEEDNQQRVIFRVVPLCTKDGVSFQDRLTEFPDEGSLRVVPDKREQSTFKERMRTIGCFCAVQLVADGKELSKVRQNRNYAPDQGEKNQLAIYSDVISEFDPDGLFEVVESAQAQVRTPRALLLRNKVLYGPVAAEELATVQLDALKPFGNDAFLLQTVALPDGSKHTLYCSPEATGTWRQRRGSLRKKNPRMEEGEPIEAIGAAPAVSAPAAPTAPAPAPKAEPAKRAEPDNRKRAPRVKPAESAAQPEAKPAETAPAPKPEESALPIGTKLDILDSSITFDEQLSQLEQPLSAGANRLSGVAAAAREPIAQARPEPEADDAEAPVFNGTPLYQVGARAPRVAKRGVEEARHAIDQQLRERSGEGVFRFLDNPIENLGRALEDAWRSEDTRNQALDLLLSSESFTQPLYRRLQREARETQAVTAAQAQLEDIEAERLSLLVQLEQAQNDQKKAADKLLASLTQKKRAELDALQRELDAKKAEAETLDRRLRELGDQAAQTSMERFMENAESMVINNNGGVVLSPVIGHKHTLAEMASAVREMLAAAGFAYSEDDAKALLLHFALSDELCLLSASVEDAARFALAAMDALGLLGVTAQTLNGEAVAIVSLTPMNGLRTPTVALCPVGAPALKAKGHKTLYVGPAGDAALPLCPVIRLPQMDPRVREGRPVQALEATARESFDALISEGNPLPTEGEAWFALLESCLTEAGCDVPQALLQDMRRFVALTSARVRGGFLATADLASLHWLVPLFRQRNLSPDALRRAIVSLPRTMAAMGVQ